MNSISIFSGVLLFFSAACIGLWLKKRSIRKAAFYEDYYRYLLYVMDRISYERMPIGEINSSFKVDRPSDFCEYLRTGCTSTPLSDSELTEIGKYVSEIGMTDADTQIASLGGKCAEMKRFTEGQCEKMRKDGALYFKLSVLLGVAAFIIIV